MGLAACVGLLYSCGRQEPTTKNESVDVSRRYTEAQLLRGKYLVTIAGCHDCHSPKIMGPLGPAIDSTVMLSGYPANRPLPEFPASAIAQGLVVVNGDLTAAMGPWGTSFSANITPHETGIGNWSEDQFVNAINHGKYKGLDAARPLMPPMPWQNLAHLTPEDTRSIFAYLQSIPPVANLVPDYRPADQAN